MGKYRNIADEPLFVGHLDRTVQPDEVVDDVDGSERVWPETLWEGVGGPPKQTTTTATKNGE